MKMYYVESENGREQEMIDFLKSLNLKTSVVETHYFYFKRTAHGELIAWHDGDKYPCFVHRAQENIVRDCGIKLKF